MTKSEKPTPAEALGQMLELLKSEQAAEQPYATLTELLQATYAALPAAQEQEKLIGELVAVLKEAVACGMVPLSSAKEGGASKYSIQVRTADKIRALIARAEGKPK